MPAKYDIGQYFCQAQLNLTGLSLNVHFSSNPTEKVVIWMKLKNTFSTEEDVAVNWIIVLKKKKAQLAYVRRFVCLSSVCCWTTSLNMLPPPKLLWKKELKAFKIEFQDFKTFSDDGTTCRFTVILLCSMKMCNAQLLQHTRQPMQCKC